MQLDDSYYLDSENPDVVTQSRIVTYGFAGTIDIIIADEAIFESYAYNSFFPYSYSCSVCYGIGCSWKHP